MQFAQDHELSASLPFFEDWLTSARVAGDGGHHHRHAQHVGPHSHCTVHAGASTGSLGHITASGIRVHVRIHAGGEARDLRAATRSSNQAGGLDETFSPMKARRAVGTHWWASLPMKMGCQPAPARPSKARGVAGRAGLAWYCWNYCCGAIAVAKGHLQCSTRFFFLDRR